MVSARTVALCFLLGAAAVGLVIISIVPSFPVISDFADYDLIAQAIAAHGSYITVSAQAIIYPPLYPLFLAGIYALVGHEYAAVYFLQFLLLGAIGYLVYALLRGRVAHFFAIAAGVITVLWPYLLLYSYLVSAEVLYTFFFVASVLALLCALDRPRTRTFALAGVLFGCAALARPVILLLPVWLTLGSFVLSRIGFDGGTWEKSRKFLAASFTAYILVLAPWILYTYVELGQVIPVASNLANVWQKSNVTLEYLDGAGQSTKEDSVVLAKLQNVYLFWDPGASGYQMEALTQHFPVARYAALAYRIGFAVILLFAIGALGIRNAFPWIMWAVIGYVWAVHVVLFPSPRYTLPIIPFVIAAAAYAADVLWTLLKRRRRLPS